MLLKEFREDIWLRNDLNAKKEISEVTGKKLSTKAHRIQSGEKSGAWISAQKSTVNGIDMGAQ